MPTFEVISAAAIGGGSGSASYSVYTALLTQTGTDAPVATVLENTLGGTVVWTYDSVGIYIATLTGAFTVNKTFIFIGSINGELSNSYGVNTAYPLNGISDYINVVTLNASFVEGNDQLKNTSIEIRVYP